MESSDCNTSLDLELGFRHEFSSRLVRKKLKHGRSDNKLPFLALGFSEPNEDEEDDAGDLKRSDVAAVASSSYVAVSSPLMFSQASKLSDEEDEDYSTTPRKKLRLSKDQISALEDNFKLHSTLNPKQKQELAAQLNLLPRQVEVWFQNRRARVKVKQTEMEREELRKRCEFLKEENIRLKKEVMNMKKKKMVLPFLRHQTPVPTLITLCPSCGCSNNSTSKIKLPSVNPFSN